MTRCLSVCLSVCLTGWLNVRLRSGSRLVRHLLKDWEPHAGNVVVLDANADAGIHGLVNELVPGEQGSVRGQGECRRSRRVVWYQDLRACSRARRTYLNLESAAHTASAREKEASFISSPMVLLVR